MVHYRYRAPWACVWASCIWLWSALMQGAFLAIEFPFQPQHIAPGLVDLRLCRLDLLHELVELLGADAVKLCLQHLHTATAR